MEFTPKNRATVQNMPKLPYAVEEALNRLRVNVSFLGCTRNCGTPCRHPEKVRPSLEAFGFDIAKTLAELFNIELLWGKDGKLPEYLVLVSGFFHNEYELCNIAY